MTVVTIERVGVIGHDRRHELPLVQSVQSNVLVVLFGRPGAWEAGETRT